MPHTSGYVWVDGNRIFCDFQRYSVGKRYMGFLVYDADSHVDRICMCIPNECAAHQIRSEKRDVEMGTYLFIFFRIFRMVVLTPVE